MAAEYVYPGGAANRGGDATEPARRQNGDGPSHHIGCPLEWLKCVIPVVQSKEQLAVAIWLHRRRAAMQTRVVRCS